jgi:hypothetical protein
MRAIEVGSVVAFNKLDDAAWFDVLAIDGMTLTLREHGTDYAKQFMDKSLVKQVRSVAEQQADLQDE